MRPLSLFGAAASLSVPAQALRVAASQMWLEHTPVAYAIKNFYKGDTATLVSGGVASLSDKTVDLGANAETQGLKNYVRNKNYRLIGIIVEVTYRLVANKAAGINTLADLKGKRIGTIAGSSAEVFINQLLSSAGLSKGQYTTVNGAVCMKAPCGSGTFPQQLKSRSIDAYGVWETAVELGVEALGENNVVIFKNASIYREVYSLYSTDEKLKDAATRQKIVQFVRALNQTYDVFRNQPDKVYSTVGQLIGVDVPVLQKVWDDHKWGPGSLGSDLVDYLEYEEKYLSKADGRQAFTRAELTKFVDPTVYQDAMKPS